jgi:undecaprenyl-diphosphatase
MTNFDLSFFYFIHNFANKFFLLDWLGIFLASYVGYFIVFWLIFILWKEKKFKRRFYLFALLALSIILSRAIIAEIIYFIYKKPRPFVVLNIEPLIVINHTPSFPSGHASAFFALAAALYLFYRKQNFVFKNRTVVAIWVLVILMGLARIFVGVHWPFDILGGAIIGILSALFIAKILPSVDVS